MKLSEFKLALKNSKEIKFILPDGSFIPQHFHVTEVAEITKNFMDCGGTIRKENLVSFQLWYSSDLKHRLSSEKLLSIIKLSEEKIGIQDFDIEVEYQQETIGKFGLEYDGIYFILTQKQTACLAEDACGIPEEKPKIKLSELNSNSCCSPSSGCY